MKLVLDDGSEYAIKVVDDVRVVQNHAIELWVHLDLIEMSVESVIAFAKKVLPESVFIQHYFETTTRGIRPAALAPATKGEGK